MKGRFCYQSYKQQNPFSEQFLYYLYQKSHKILIMSQFSSLAYKNFILYKRGILGSIFELLLPIAFICFFVLVRHLLEVNTLQAQSFVDNTDYDFTLSSVLLANNEEPFKDCSQKIIALAPAGSEAIVRLQTVFAGLGLNSTLYDSDEEINEVVRKQEYGTEKYPYFCFGVTFDSDGPNYKYNVRFNITARRSRSEGPYTDRNLTTERAFDMTVYGNTYTSKMASMTHTVNSIIAQIQTGTSYAAMNATIVPIYQEYYVNDPIYLYLADSLQFLVMLPLLVVYLRQTSEMLGEKEKKIRESMSIMGMKLWVYYLTWFIRFFVIYFIVHAVSSGIMSATLPQIPFYIPFVVFILFDILLIVQSFFIQIFFTKAKIGVVFALLFFIFQYVINYIVASNENPTVQIFQIVSIVPHVAFIQAFKAILYAESYKVDIDFVKQINYYTITTAIISLICNIVFWGLLSIYLDQVVPNEWGAKKHPCFCFMCKNKKDDESQDETLSNSKIQLENKSSDVESVDGKCKEMEMNNQTIKIQNLVKNFDEIKAVENLNLTMYKDQIFVLLGHNGAGKTTTISMLTGMLSPSHGQISVLGQTQIQQIRENLGVCPQHDTLYDELTVKEHLQLFATFRGFSGQQLTEQVNKLISDVNLQEKRDEYAKNLSGGQKRRLSVALAFAGGSKVIILDEPTSGMDTSARRYIWQMLKNYKNDRIILLTTHFMDEADYLGDRIGIMAKGKLVTCGSSVYLKNKYGVGYNIVFVKKDIQVASENIITTVKKYIQNSVVLSDVSCELGIQLPLDQVKNFSRLFTQIDKTKQELGILTYGISITTLQEVFLKVGENDDEEEKIRAEELSEIEEIKLVQGKKNQIIPEDIEDWEREDGLCERFVSHLLATILKRIRVIKRDLKSFLFQLILPMGIITLALLLMTVTFVKDSPWEQLSYHTYYDNQSSPSPVTLPIGSNDSTFLSDIQGKVNDVYKNIISVETSTSSTPKNFDTNFLFPLKQSDETLKGGIYFWPQDSGVYSYKAFANTRSPTSILAVQTLATEAYMNYISGNTSTITVVNAPFPRTYHELRINNAISGFFGALIFSIALAFKFASIVSFIVKERVDKSKHQQIVSGMNIGSYWFGNFIYDFFLYAIVIGFSIGMCYALDIEALLQGQSYKATILLFVIFGLANIPLTYIFGYFFIDYGNAQAGIYFFNFVTGGILPILILVLRWITVDEDPVPSGTVARGLAWLLRIIPAFSFGQGMINIGSISALSRVENSGQSQYDVFHAQITLGPIIYLSVGFLAYIALLFTIQSIQNNESCMRCCSSEQKIQETEQITDEDVLLEREKAIQAQPEDYQILTKKLRKVYVTDNQKGYKVAVDSLSFRIKKGQVFGLLGINGAGKTTTFKMLAGEVVSTDGESFFSGHKISQNLSTIRKNLGYCPQFDALIEGLTVRQQLELYYDMKCLPSHFKQQAINEKIKEMNLEEYESKLSGSLSGGNKRKLSVAMAMIGNPKIVFLDQPSTGMDPKARRFMWKVISRISTEKKQSTIILTTHSMEEAQALSTRLGIMVNGNFKCIGAPQHIKSKYGKGFEIEIKLKILKRQEISKIRNQASLSSTEIVKDTELQTICEKLKIKKENADEIKADGKGNYLWKDLKDRKKITLSSLIQFNETQTRITRIQEALQGKFGQVQVLQQLQSYVRFKTLSSPNIGGMFQFLESKKENLFIQQYSIKQVTVEQIFNKFAEEEGNMNMD